MYVCMHTYYTYACMHVCKYSITNPYSGRPVQAAGLENYGKSGMTVFREGDASEKFYIILEGCIRLESRQKGWIGALYA
jgi:hypothetical protein